MPSTEVSGGPVSKQGGSRETVNGCEEGLEMDHTERCSETRSRRRVFVSALAFRPDSF